MVLYMVKRWQHIGATPVGVMAHWIVRNLSELTVLHYPFKKFVKLIRIYPQENIDSASLKPGRGEASFGNGMIFMQFKTSQG